MAIQPQRILWPTDFSELSLHGGRYARGFAEQFDAEIHILHVVPPPISPDVSVVVAAEVPVAVSEQELMSAARTQLENLAREHFSGCGKLTLVARLGSPWQTICAYAREQEIDLIVTTTHGRTGLTHVLIGSTAERIVQHAPCPVLAVKHPQREFLRA